MIFHEIYYVLFSAFQYIDQAIYKFCYFGDDCTLTPDPTYGVSMYMKKGKYELLFSDIDKKLKL